MPNDTPPKPRRTTTTRMRIADELKHKLEELDKEKRRVEEQINNMNRMLDDLTAENEQLRKENKELAGLTTLDPLTNLINKTECQRVLEVEMDRAKRTGKPVSLAFLDIDSFKKINDNYGQRKGDEILQLFAKTLKKHFRIYDVIGRYGGEEFIIVFPNTSAIEAYRVMEKRREEMKDDLLVKLGDNLGNITFSAGVASNEDAKNAETLVNMTNQAERVAKEEGKNRVYLNLCGAMLDRDEVENTSSNVEIRGIIERHREGRIKIYRGNTEVPFPHFLKTAKVVQEGDAQADFKIVTIGGEPTTVFSAYLRAPNDDDARNAVKDTADQLLMGLERAARCVFPDPNIELWQYPGKLNFLNLLITHACPMNCIYCTQQHQREPALDETMWKKAIFEASEGGERKGVILSITGGEPLTSRKLVMSLLHYARELGMYTTMNTNAMLITPEVAKEMVESGIRSLNISLDSANPYTEDTITRTERAFGRIIEGLKNIARIRGESMLKRITLNHVITKINVTELPDFIKKMCIERSASQLKFFDDINPIPVKEAPGLFLGIKEIELFNKFIVPEVARLARKHELPVLEKKIMSIFAADVSNRAEYESRVWSASQGRYYGDKDMRLPCATVMVSATILPDGTVFPCTYQREVVKESKDRVVLGNIKDESLVEMRKRYFERLRMLPRNPDGNLNSICENCCGPDLKGINQGVRSILRKAGTIPC